MSKIIDFEQHKPILLTRVADADPLLATFEDSDGQKYIAMPSHRGMSFIPLFEDGKLDYYHKTGHPRIRMI